MFNKQELLERLNRTPANANRPTAKLNAFINYLADNYSENAIGDMTVEEAVYIARNDILKNVFAVRDAQGLQNDNGDLLSNNGVYGTKGNWTMGYFLRYPKDAVQYLLVSAKQQAIKNGDRDRANRFQSVAEDIQDKRFVYDNFVFDKGKRENDMINLEAKYIGENGVDQAFNANKAGFFDRLFRRTSSQYKQFEKLFKAYRYDPKAVDERNSRAVNRGAVENSAIEYLKHKLPNYKGKGLPSLDDINRLQGKSKNRALLCYNVLVSAKESKEFEERDRAFVDTIEKQMSEDGTNYVTDKLYKTNSIDPEEIKGVLNDFAPIKVITSITGPDKEVELTEKQKLFQKSLANDLEDKKIGVDVQRLSKDMHDLSIDSIDDPNKSFNMD